MLQNSNVNNLVKDASNVAKEGLGKLVILLKMRLINNDAKPEIKSVFHNNRLG